jgi:hypothetical protein
MTDKNMPFKRCQPVFLPRSRCCFSQCC